MCEVPKGAHFFRGMVLLMPSRPVTLRPVVNIAGFLRIGAGELQSGTRRSITWNLLG